MSNIFEISHVNFKYSNGEMILKDVSFKVKKGSFCTIVGSNGSGKTTLIKLLAGITKPTEGSIVKKTDFSALVFQNPENQFISNIVEEDVAFGPENLCFPSEKIRKVVDESLKCVDMLEEKNRTVSSLSGGEKQRVAIAGALALSSECLILDEPTSMVGSDKNIVDYILKMNKENGTTVICVTQDPKLMLLSDSVVVMKNGQIVDCVNPEKFVAEYERFADCGIVLPESIKLVRLLNEKGYDIKLNNVSPESIVEEIMKRC